MITWVFVLLFMMPSFGGPVTFRGEFTSQDGCERIQKVAVRLLAENGMDKYELIECHKEVRP